uniref:Uncharacterized protein n=1 Tax=Heterorhabditis bacteriophora TaxID=37862 RepID=A0A1I7XD86_HETBA
MFSLRSMMWALIALIAFFCVTDARNLQPYGNYQFLDSEGMNLGDYRLEQFGEYINPQKRVPSAGDMMVRFGKRAD